MINTPGYALEDESAVKDLLREHPWCTLVSYVPGRGIVASHYPVLIDEAEDEFTVFSHVGRPDDVLHELSQHEVAIIVQGPHGYISPSWYGDGPAVPTWNHVTAHLYGTPELVSEQQNLQYMDTLVDFFEDHVESPARLNATAENTAYAERLVRGTAAFRMRITRFEAKLKMSQGKPPEVVDRVIDALREPGPYRQPEVAQIMEQVHHPHA